VPMLEFKSRCRPVSGDLSYLRAAGPGPVEMPNATATYRRATANAISTRDRALSFVRIWDTWVWIVLRDKNI
jgi:hypothetical protein